MFLLTVADEEIIFWLSSKDPFLALKGKVTAEFSHKKFISNEWNVIFSNSLIQYSLIMKIQIRENIKLLESIKSIISHRSLKKIKMNNVKLRYLGLVPEVSS